jgi:uncharacterized RDD family membrane protein YckC
MTMPGTGSQRIAADFDIKPHAYDPVAQPELFEGVRTRRIFAFLVDLLMITVPLMLFAVFILMFGLVTLGLGWFLFALFSPIAVIWALLYYGFSFAGPASATVGMRMTGLEMRTWYGAPAYFVLGAMHAVGYWLTVSFLTPFVLLVSLFDGRKRLLHDMLLGTVVINNAERTSRLRGHRGV